MLGGGGGGCVVVAAWQPRRVELARPGARSVMCEACLCRMPIREYARAPPSLSADSDHEFLAGLGTSARGCSTGLSSQSVELVSEDGEVAFFSPLGLYGYGCVRS